MMMMMLMMKAMMMDIRDDDGRTHSVYDWKKKKGEEQKTLVTHSHFFPHTQKHSHIETTMLPRPCSLQQLGDARTTIRCFQPPPRPPPPPHPWPPLSHLLPLQLQRSSMIFARLQKRYESPNTNGRSHPGPTPNPIPGTTHPQTVLTAIRRGLR